MAKIRIEITSRATRPILYLSILRLRRILSLALSFSSFSISRSLSFLYLYPYSSLSSLFQSLSLTLFHFFSLCHHRSVIRMYRLVTRRIGIHERTNRAFRLRIPRMSLDRLKLTAPPRVHALDRRVPWEPLER